MINLIDFTRPTGRPLVAEEVRWTIAELEHRSEPIMLAEIVRGEIEAVQEHPGSVEQLCTIETDVK